MIVNNINNAIINIINPESICVTYKDISKIDVFISFSLYYYLTKSKKRIDNNVEIWDFYKKITNPYEYIHTPPFFNLPYSVSKYVAISRSFYKLIEIINYFNLHKNYNKKTINSFHLAEGPGGFIEAMIYLRKNNEYSLHDRYHGMTLRSNNKNVPKWRKLTEKFKFNKKIVIEYGDSNNGDLMDVNNFRYCVEKYKNSMDFMTGDGGFDFSVDYEKQELASSKLVFSQVMYALMLQKYNGNFVLKIFDIFYKSTVEIIYLLSSFYKSVDICKPKTSRFANSEKYIVCSGFLLNDTSNYYEKFYEIIESLRDNDMQTFSSIFNFDIPQFYVKEIEELNVVLGKKQLSVINTTLQCANENRDDKIMKIRKNNIDKCLLWCQANNMQYNAVFKPENMFSRYSKNKNTK